MSVRPPFQRLPVETPAGAMQRLRGLGMLDAGPDGLPFWETSAAYFLDEAAAGALLAAAASLQALMDQALDRLVTAGDYSHFGLAHPAMAEAIGTSWRKNEFPLYGRMDFSFDTAGTPKLLDYEADSPTGLAEASFAQWEWFEAWQEGRQGRGSDSQENLLYEELTAHLPRLDLPRRFAIAAGGAVDSQGRPTDTAERFDAEYLAELARAANLMPRICSIEAVGWDSGAQRFTDDLDEPLGALLKIYPWDWMEEEANIEVVPQSRTRLLPAAYTRLLGDKTLLALLWHMAPGNPHLLPSFLDAPASGEMVAKPRRGWDGEHVSLPGQPVSAAPEHEVGPLLYQAHCPLPVLAAPHGEVHANVSVWMVGGKPAGLSFRESRGPITRADCRFVPHVLRG